MSLVLLPNFSQIYEHPLFKFIQYVYLLRINEVAYYIPSHLRKCLFIVIVIQIPYSFLQAQSKKLLISFPKFKFSPLVFYLMLFCLLQELGPSFTEIPVPTSISQNIQILPHSLLPCPDPVFLLPFKFSSSHFVKLLKSCISLSLNLLMPVSKSSGPSYPFNFFDF